MNKLGLSWCLCAFWDPAPVEAAYHRLGQAVKQRIENPVNVSVE